MKIPINLASQPFRRDRAMLVASAAISLALVMTLGLLFDLAMLDRAQLADPAQKISTSSIRGFARSLRSRRRPMPFCASLKTLWVGAEPLHQQPAGV